jgi:hypothetical protein
MSITGCQSATAFPVGRRYTIRGGKVDWTAVVGAGVGIAVAVGSRVGVMVGAAVGVGVGGTAVAVAGSAVATGARSGGVLQATTIVVKISMRTNLRMLVYRFIFLTPCVKVPDTCFQIEAHVTI